MNTVNSSKFYRWVLLRHTGAPDDFKGIHFDLLLEDKNSCRTWRLSDIPVLDGPYVDSVPIAPHNLDWLDTQEKVISANRGVATRIKNGLFFQSLPRIEKSFINLSLKWEEVDSSLIIDENGCRIFSRK